MGMGGIGKTTLARNIFDNALIKEHFDVRVWTTVSQIYDATRTLGELLSQASNDSSVGSENEVGGKLRKFLWKKRYLIVLDDIWSVDAWDKMRFFFPDNENRSRILVTARLSNFGSQLNEPYGVGMNFLDEESSWELFSKTVFGEESVPIKLKEVGKKIVAKCRGLPLSIATIGGLLAKSRRKIEYWKHIEENLNSIVIADEDERCLKVLRMSYIHLPNYLKPCFLYMGVFEEDRRIHVSTLVKLWVCEGFLKPRSGKCLEAAAKEYLNDLIDRNLILVDELGATGNLKYCKIHDLLRDLCLREAENHKFYHVLKQLGRPPRGMNRQRRIVIPRNISTERTLEAFKSPLSRARSLLCDAKEVRVSGDLRLLRTLKAYDRHTDSKGYYTLGDVFRLVNSRYLAVGTQSDSEIPSSINLLWNLQALIVYSWQDVTAPIGIWKMHQLRHVEFSPSRRISFPHSLKKLNLSASAAVVFELGDMLQKIGSLPLLQKLEIVGGFFGGREWETTQGHFRSLKSLHLSLSKNLDDWIVSESSHFPVLEHLYLSRQDSLKEIPSEIGEISTLKLIELSDCSRSAVLSAKTIVEEQESYHGDQLDLHVQVRYMDSRKHRLKYLAGPNFHVKSS